jgi:hypothetical protein
MALVYRHDREAVQAEVVIGGTSLLVSQQSEKSQQAQLGIPRGREFTGEHDLKPLYVSMNCCAGLSHP